MGCRSGSITIANGATNSGWIPIGGSTFGSFILPSAFTGTSVTFDVALNDGQATVADVRDTLNQEIIQYVTVGDAFPLPREVFGWPWARITSGSAEGAARTIYYTVGEGVGALKKDGVTYRATKTSALDGAANNGQLAAPTITLFTVTGDILIVTLTATCTETHVSAGAGTLALGVTGNTAFFIAATTATAIAAGEYWIDATPTEVNAALVPAGFKDVWCTDNIIATVGTADITDGTIRYDLYWVPLSADTAVS